MISALLPLLLAAPAVLGHGQVHNFLTADGTVWPAADAYAAANLTSPFRHVNTYGPVPDFTTSDITCGVRNSRGLFALDTSLTP
jgi:cellulase